MREKSIVPTTLLDWPRVAPLMPEQKLIIEWLWACRYLTSVGAGALPLRAAAATLGLAVEALITGLRQLKDLDLIIWDEKTGEVFVRDWFRFHTFSGLGRRIARAQFAKIQSSKIREAVLTAGGSIFRDNPPETDPETKDQELRSPTPTQTPTSTSTLTSTTTSTDQTPPPDSGAGDDENNPPSLSPDGGDVEAYQSSLPLSSSGGDELVYPSTLSEPERWTAERYLRECPPEMRQLVLDELAGAIAAGTPKNALSYLRRGLIERVQAGTFVPELAYGVAEDRRRRALNRAAVDKANVFPPVGPGKSPEEGIADCYKRLGVTR